jgi:hypothetical protein
VLARAVRDRALLQRAPGGGRVVDYDYDEDYEEDFDDGVEEDIDPEDEDYIYRPGWTRHKHTLGQHLHEALEPIRKVEKAAREQARKDERARAKTQRLEQREQRRQLREPALAAYDAARDAHATLEREVAADTKYQALWQALAKIVQAERDLPDHARNWAGWLAAATACTDRIVARRRELQEAERERVRQERAKPIKGSQWKTFRGKLQILIQAVGPAPKSAQTERARRLKPLRAALETLNLKTEGSYNLEDEDKLAELQQLWAAEAPVTTGQTVVTPTVVLPNSVFAPPVVEGDLKAWLATQVPSASAKNIGLCTAVMMAHTPISGGGTSTYYQGDHVFHISHGKYGLSDSCSVFYTKDHGTGGITIVGAGQHVDNYNARYKLTFKLPGWTHATKFVGTSGVVIDLQF